MRLSDAIDYLRPIAESATVGHYGEALHAVLWAAEQYMDGDRDE